MKALLRLVALCFVVLFSLSAGIVLISAAQADYAPLPELHHCEIGICVLGIIPQTTAYAEARKIIEDDPTFTLRGRHGSIADKQAFPYYRLQLYLSTTSDAPALMAVSETDLVFPKDQTAITAAVIVAQLGAPCVTTAPSYVVLMYPGAVFMFGAEIQGKLQRLDPSLPLKEIHLFRNTKSCADLLKKYPAGKWKGFTSYCRYSEIQTQYLALYQNLPYDC